MLCLILWIQSNKKVVHHKEMHSTSRTALAYGCPFYRSVSLYSCPSHCRHVPIISYSLPSNWRSKQVRVVRSLSTRVDASMTFFHIAPLRARLPPRLSCRGAGRLSPPRRPNTRPSPPRQTRVTLESFTSPASGLCVPLWSLASPMQSRNRTVRSFPISTSWW